MIYKKFASVIFLSLASLLFTGGQDALAGEKCEDPVYLKPASAVASSFDDSEWAPEPNPMAVGDGDFNTRWSPVLGRDGEWIFYDFGKPKTFTKTVICWERAYSPEYELLVSDDAKQWKPVMVLKNRRGGTDTIGIPQTTARYLKLVGLKRSNPEWGISIWEWEVYGPKELNPEDKPIEQVFPDRKLREVIKLSMEAPAASPGPVTAAEFQKGVNYASYNESDLAAKESDTMLEYLKTINVTHVCFIVTWYQDTLESMKIYPESPEGGRTPVDEALTHAINKAHSLGFKVMLKPHIDIQTGEFRGDIPGEEEWFRNYEEFILKYAKMAEKYNVEIFCIGTELAGTPMKWEPQWRKIIKSVRGNYKGPITYAANWNEYKEVPFWNDLDFIGIDAYFPLTSKANPAKAELAGAWEKEARSMEDFFRKKGINKPVIFTEAGYTSAEGTGKTPWTVPSKVESQKEQADCLDAMMTVMTKRVWFKGLYWWCVFPQDIESPLGYTIKGKSAEKVLAGWYKTAK
ncbi:MAG: discoidin domain-containing protein [Candidatus Omnitrophota bacterium]|jgi:hypothetical protein